MSIINKLRLFITLWKGGTRTMVDIYVALIINKRRSIDQVPAQLKDAVLADLTVLGLDGYGNSISAE
ncbi:CD1375 family protein [Petroclostridium sp. X23]|uniref:CD1375 family protein n=1 Tax=Petroclostridium sp. X23 TaxID=3045146 RepID=UPI0024ACF728|nr:CD1375 family protein [Petroclostridium sp. X23]WHH58325.1 CD1375 family protein [Petroclostridium sp. X23]